ncbi:serpin-ZXA-like [Iris pallida]|uniref:Serpin-ZXA-like n=1 Tax=Iris pallida TaxID=29817 RepID=A0AAX6HKF1_IRIPA|nr:serpin-ZXA-like [Iris pallida]
MADEAVPVDSSVVQSPVPIFGTATPGRAVPIDSCLQFAERLGLLAAAEGSNFVFSPASMRAALSLAAAGSGGETLQQMLSFLGSPTVADLNSSAAAVLGSVTETAPASAGAGACQLAFVNGVWVDSSMALKPSFEETATSVYSAVAKSVDFFHHAPSFVKEVNNFVEMATNGLIKDLIPAQSVGRDTKLVLANALYFKGIWANKFDRSETRNGEFHLLDGSTIDTPFMTSTRKQFVSTFDGFKVLRLPYQSAGQQRSFSMLIFLPNSRDGMSSLVQMAVSQPNFLNRHFPNRLVGVSQLSIPKFTLSSNFEATKVLKGLGLELPFDEALADFGEMTGSTDGRPYVSSVHHKATIEVEEEGTVAAAATAVAFKKMCYSQPVDFRADHPFMFAIREEVSGAVLFLGHVANPSLVD